jgi:DNA-directed RNA polymerase subunit beta'
MKTTVGNILFNDILPQEMRDYSRELNKRKIYDILADLGKNYPKDYAVKVKKIKDLGDEVATVQGSSFSLADFAPRKEAKEIQKKYKSEYDKLDSITNQVAKDDKRREINAKVEDEINAKVKKSINDKSNRFLRWGAAGAKGGPANFRQILFASGNQVDVKKEVFPHMSQRSLSEGLSPSDYFITSTGARTGVVNSFLQVRDPGAFSKEISANVNDNIVTELDCGTTTGRTYPVHSRDVLDRCLAAAAGKYKRNDVITDAVQDNMERQGVKTVKVRTPLTCEMQEGVCSKCIGMAEDGTMAPLGDAIGVRSAQAISEPLTQMALSAKHSGGVVGKKSAYQIINQLLHAPENFPNGAVLAHKDGTVERIVNAPDGGKNIFVAGEDHYVKPKVPVRVKVGQKVEAGDKLSDGLVNHKELVQLKGMEKGRESLTANLREIYAENGYDGRPQVFETVVRSLLNHGIVEDPGDHDDLVEEEIVRWNQTAYARKKETKRLSVDNAIGWRLKSEVNGLPAGTLITDGNIEKLGNVETVEVYKKPAKIKPYMLSTEQAVHHNKDFISAMGFRNIRQALERGVSEAQQSNIHGTNPITPYAYGAEFGQGLGGRY